MKVAGLVLAAGSSRRLGQPKQLLVYKGRTLLDAVLDLARSAPFDQRLVTVGGAAPEVLEAVDSRGFEVVESVHHTEGCSSSIVSALSTVGADVDGIVMLLGDQPEVQLTTIENMVSAVAENRPPLAVCRYENGIGHPFWFGREVFADLELLHGDKAVWKVIEAGTHRVAEVSVPGDVPLDVDTWDDYEHLLTATGQPLQNLCTPPPQRWSRAQILEGER